MEIRDVMTRDPICVDAWDPLSAAEQLLRNAEVRHLVVMHDGRVVGVLSDRDVLRAHERAGLHSRGRWIREVMAEPETVDAEEDVRRAATLLAARTTDCLPVVDHDRLVGIVTRSDLLRALAREGLDETTVLDRMHET